jgi:hypothetical protein
MSPGEASAQEGGWYTMERPGQACFTQDPTMIVHWATILNTDATNTHTVWCPLDTPNTDSPSSVHVYVTQSWATTTSCVYAALVDLNAGWFYPVSSLTNNNNNQTTSIGFNIPSFTGLYGSEVECYIPPKQYVMAYDERIMPVFFQTSWF